MKPKIATARAIAAYTAQKSLTFATITYLIVATLLFVVIWLLSYNLSPWWWLFAVPLLIITLIFFGLRLILSFIIHKIYRHPFSRIQREKLEEFTAKVTSIAAVRSTPLPFYAFITLWDIVRTKDATTIRKVIDDSRSLKNDYSTLEKYFGER